MRTRVFGDSTGGATAIACRRFWRWRKDGEQSLRPSQSPGPLARAPHVVPIPGTRGGRASRRMRRGGGFRSQRDADRRNRARSAGRLRRGRAHIPTSSGSESRSIEAACGRERGLSRADRLPLGERRLLGRRPEQRADPVEQTAARRALDQGREIGLRPPRDVVFQQMGEHRRVPLAPFLERHFERPLERRRPPRRSRAD